MRIRFTLPASSFLGRHERLVVGPMTVAPDSPLNYEDRRVGTLLSADVVDDGATVEVTAEVEDLVELRASGFPHPITTNVPTPPEV